VFSVLFKKELLENVRTHRLLVLAVVLIFFGILSPVTARYMSQILTFAMSGQQDVEPFLELIPPPTTLDSVDQYIKNLTGVGLLVVALLIMGLVAREKDRGTVVLVLARPVSRLGFLLAKFAAFSAWLVLCVLAAGAVAYLYTGLLFGEWLAPGPFAVLNGLMILYFLVVAAFTFLGSTLTRSSFAAAAIGLGGWALISLVGNIRVLSDYVPGHLATAAALLARGERFTAWPAVGVSAGLVALCLVISALSFQRQEL
jgi:ABC-2 type transport system permease protein